MEWAICYLRHSFSVIERFDATVTCGNWEIRWTLLACSIAASVLARYGAISGDLVSGGVFVGVIPQIGSNHRRQGLAHNGFGGQSPGDQKPIQRSSFGDGCRRNLGTAKTY